MFDIVYLGTTVSRTLASSNKYPMKQFSQDEPNEAINLLLWTTAVWTDEFLTWNPSVMDGCTNIKLEAKKIWTPNIYFVNT
jgi:hypothetical protein